MAKPVIQIDHLTKYFGSFTGVSNISFTVEQGEIFGFLGPNGAGKTTTIRMLLDLLRPSSGNIRIFDKVVRENSAEIRKHCGYLPGNFNAYGNLTGWEFLQLSAKLRGMSFRKDSSLLGRFELSFNHLNKKIKYLSHGTNQKLGIVQAFLHHPDLLILDEPTIGLDPLMQEEFYDLLKEHHSMGATIFLSSHNLTEVERICSRMAIIRQGILEKTDTIINLRKLLRKRMQITLSDQIENLHLTGTEFIQQNGLHYEFFINGDIRIILKELSELPLVEITLPEPGLDEIFINFYKDEMNA